MASSRVEQNAYHAEEVWLHAHFEDIDILDLDFEVEIKMLKQGIALPELLEVLREGTVDHAERDYEGCLFIVSGRNCDDEHICIWGVLCSETCDVSVIDIQKIR